MVNWVESLGEKYKEYSKVFKDNGIDGEMLKDLETEELSEMGLKSKLHRRKIITASRRLFKSSNGSVGASNSEEIKESLGH